MKYVSLFAGIGGFDLALNRLGHKCVYVNEWDKYAAQTYEKNFGHRPDTRSIADVSADDIPKHDLLVGGFPCQAFSVAGKRRGFEDIRGTLFYEICRILRSHRTPYFLLENVKGLLSHDGGRTFYTIQASIDELGYDCEWSVLNSKNFGVPQNRERVFIIGHLRGVTRPKIFPLTEATGTTDTGSHTNNTQIEIAQTLRSRYGNGSGSHVQRIPLKFLSRNQRNIEGDYAFTVDSMNTGGVMITKPKIIEQRSQFGKPLQVYEDYAPTVQTFYGTGGNNVPTVNAIRRLTPIECERLQGFPDNWTEGVSDTQRYKQLGNAVTVNVVWAIARKL